MSDLRKPSYTKDMRELAKSQGKYLVTVDFVRPNGTHELCSQGPYTKEEARVILDAWLSVMKARKPETVPTQPTHCRCGRPLIYSGPDDSDPWCSSTNMSARFCDTVEKND